ncbi:MAG TPA: glycosyltransferase [Steroidobacteraceae bacterium]|nr:glycosyltransferase [Steroidobacteraceae bacterium]
MTAAPPERLHVVQLGFFNDPARRGPDELLEAWPSLADVAEAATQGQVRVSVVQACARVEVLERAGVRYHFLPFGEASGDHGLGPLIELLRGLRPHLLHVHGLDFPRQVLALARLVPGAPIILQDHASRPPAFWRRALLRRAFAAAGGVAFCAAEQARPFVAAGILTPRTPIYPIPESTSRFLPGDREAARETSGLAGDPALLWVGHLDANKDPLTILDAVSAAAQALPGMRLHCCFGVAPLRDAVEARIARDPQLRGRVQLWGRVAHLQVEQLMRAADLFVLGSHREGSGYALIEALACGLPPLVTDIPSFRALTGAGAIGHLWPCGDAGALDAALRVAARWDRDRARQTVRAHFERELSFAALGAKLAAMYREVAAREHHRAFGSSGCIPGSVSA